jgi:HSP20 family molecular chaperone IbpA
MILETPNFYCVKVQATGASRDDVKITFGPTGLRVKARTGQYSGFTKAFKIMPHDVCMDSVYATWNSNTVTVIARKRKRMIKDKIIELS